MRAIDFIKLEQNRQDETIELIASENFVSDAIREAAGSCLTNKYAEGYPYHRYYGGCEHVDALEEYCQKKWQEVFKTDYHVNVQPHSGSQANMAASMAVCKPGDTILSMDLNDGGHLTHGSPVSFSGKLYHVEHYGLDEKGYIDEDAFRRRVQETRPRLIIIGASAYPREIPYKNMCDAAKAVDPSVTILVDMAHVAGLIAAGLHETPFNCADIITTTTHKTLRGPRGGLIFCRPELAKKVDMALFPGIQGGPLMHVIAAKAVCAEEALSDEYADYMTRVKKNAEAMADEFIAAGMDVITGGTDTHMLLLDLSTTHPHVTGKMAQDYLDKIGITLNKNMIHGDKRKPSECSGLRIGTAAMTTKGNGEDFFCLIAYLIKNVLDRLESDICEQKKSETN